MRSNRRVCSGERFRTFAIILELVPQGLLYHYYGGAARYARPWNCSYAFTGRHFAHEPAPPEPVLLHHFFGNGKPWQAALFASPADARAYDAHHEGKFCAWWWLLASWKTQMEAECAAEETTARAASCVEVRNSTCWRAFDVHGKTSVGRLSAHASSLCAARQRRPRHSRR